MAKQCSSSSRRGSELKVKSPDPSEDKLLTSGRFERLEWTISALTQRVNVLEADRSHSDSHTSETAYQTPATEDHYVSPQLGRIHSADQSPAPLFVLRDVTTNMETDMPDIDRTATNSPSHGLSDDIIVKRLISPQEAFTLLDLFQTHYARWVSFDKSTPVAVLLEHVRKFPLLLTACCLIAVR